MAVKGWHETILGEFVTLQRGHDLPDSERKPGNIPVIGSSGITGYHDAAIAKGPGVTIGRSGASFGMVIYSSVDFWPHNACLYVIDFHGNDERFAYYFLKSMNFSSFNSGSAQPSLNRNYIHPIMVRVPPLPEQLAIASILGALDDKIELNHRMNATLEAMARAMFRQWFIENEEAGSWEVARLGDIVTLINERVDATNEKDNEKYIALDDMPSKSIDLSEYRLGTEVNSSIIRFKKGDILFGSMRPYFHKVGLAPYDGITRTTTFVLRPKRDELRAFGLYWFFSNEVIEFSTTASLGTTIPYIRWDTLEKYEIALPSIQHIKEFNDFFQPLWLKIVTNGKESRMLLRLRDSLLPKLIRGEIRVKV
jgi:type I restriction enzyme, S subunit